MSERIIRFQEGVESDPHCFAGEQISEQVLISPAGFEWWLKPHQSDQRVDNPESVALGGKAIYATNIYIPDEWTCVRIAGRSWYTNSFHNVCEGKVQRATYEVVWSRLGNRLDHGICPDPPPTPILLPEITVTMALAAGILLLALLRRIRSW